MLPALRWADVGCCTGALTGAILDKAAPNRVIGIEPSEGFLNLARAKVEEPRAEFRLGDAQALPLDSQEAAVAVSGLVLNFIRDKNEALEEIPPVVNLGSTVAAYVWDYAGEMQLMRYFWTAVVELFPDAAQKDEGKRFPDLRAERSCEVVSQG